MWLFFLSGRVWLGKGQHLELNGHFSLRPLQRSPNNFFFANPYRYLIVLVGGSKIPAYISAQNRCEQGYRPQGCHRGELSGGEALA